ncbi:hypothetical protein [Burkholderia pseudomultivorans]|uniref:hypothetical protein n=1 Tax=Burkholderia pseudomultivorans TaxID=1207504 RepID=UPI000B26295A|nr:hypothetical protein [Burkholderia pseudomultivorans]
MPIKPENRTRYPANWKQIVEAVRERSGNRCEGSPAYRTAAPRTVKRIQSQAAASC